MAQQNEKADDKFRYKYKFQFKDGAPKEFLVELDRKSLSLIPQRKGCPPSWTELEYCKCPNCPLKEADHKYCPVALNVADVVDFFKEFISYEEVDLTIESEERGYFKTVPLQRGLSSLLGLYMVSSGCPHLDKLKPMVRYHSPFARLEETQYRALSMYLLAQYFRAKQGKKPDWDLKDLPQIYEAVRTVNKAFFKRLKGIVEEDAINNAVVILNTFADSIIYCLDQHDLERIQGLFRAYLNETP